MSIEKKKFPNGEMVIKPNEKIDVTNTAELEKEVNDEIDNITYLTIDLSEVNYISSIGLRAFLAFQKKLQSKDKMRIINVKHEVLEVFKMVGFDKVLNIE